MPVRHGPACTGCDWRGRLQTVTAAVSCAWRDGDQSREAANARGDVPGAGNCETSPSARAGEPGQKPGGAAVQQERKPRVGDASPPCGFSFPSASGEPVREASGKRHIVGESVVLLRVSSARAVSREVGQGRCTRAVVPCASRVLFAASQPILPTRQPEGCAQGKRCRCFHGRPAKRMLWRRATRRNAASCEDGASNGRDCVLRDVGCATRSGWSHGRLRMAEVAALGRGSSVDGAAVMAAAAVHDGESLRDKVFLLHK